MLRFTLLALLILALSLAACADGGDSSNGDPDLKETTTQDTTETEAEVEELDTQETEEEVIDNCSSDDQCESAHYCNALGHCAQDCMPGTTSCGDGFICTERGRCEGVDDCEGVICETPPADNCTDSTQYIYAATGACERDRGCVYFPATLACEHGCAGDVCAECTDGEDCVIGSQPFCRDGDLVVPTPSCDAGLCGSSESVTPCDYGCDNDACRPSPCEGISCTALKAPTCDGDRRIVYEATGTCTPDGDTSYTCEYAIDEAASEDCASGCTDGYCNDDPCVGVVCDEIPDDACDGDNLHTYQGNGVCNSDSGTAECVYTPSTTLCPNGCGDATCYECNGPEDCSSTSPYCDGDDRVYATAVCSEHTCSSQEQRETCAYGCDSGSCVQPCAGFTCNNPPAAFCADEATLTTYGETGTCVVDASNQPSCEYQTQDEPCGTGLVCETDGCVAPPSPDVDWCRFQWPESHEGNSADTFDAFLRVYEEGVTDTTAYANESDYGTLFGEVGYGPDGSDPATSTEWTWFAASPNPSFTGSSYADNDEFMANLTLPAASGDYDLAGRFSNNGTSFIYCDTGTSGSGDGYAPADAASLLVYATDPCTGYLCDTPPEPTCTSGTLLEQATSTEGTCSSTTGLPVCEYTMETVDCSLTSQVCVVDECVAPSADATIVFDATWNQYVVGTLVAGGNFNFDYDPVRLPNCRETGWTLYIYYTFDGLTWESTSYDSSAIIDIPAGADSITTYADNISAPACHEYDSNFGNNYVFNF